MSTFVIRLAKYFGSSYFKNGFVYVFVMFCFSGSNSEAKLYVILAITYTELKLFILIEKHFLTDENAR